VRACGGFSWQEQSASQSASSTACGFGSNKEKIMFISSAEKSIINARIENLEARVRDLTFAVLEAQKLARKIEKANSKKIKFKIRKIS
jgi:hypothetical protein